MISTAIKNVLASKQAVIDLLGNLDGSPAIFVDDEPPPSFSRETGPYVLIPGLTSRGPYEDGEQDFFEVVQRIYVAGVDGRDPAPVEDAAEMIRYVLETTPIGTGPYLQAVDGVQVDGPVATVIDDLTIARELRARFWLIKT